MKTIKVWYKLVTIIKVTEGGKKVIKNGKKKNSQSDEVNQKRQTHPKNGR